MYDDVEQRNEFIKEFKIPIFYEPVDYGSLPVTVLNKTLDWDHISEVYNRENIVVVDNFLLPEFTNILRNYALITNIREDRYLDYSATNFKRSKGCLWFKLLSNIVDECKYNIPLLSNFTFDRAWNFIYSNTSNGVNTHSDPAKVTFNLWVTPETCMQDKPEYNGLEIWKVSRPSEWSPETYTGNTPLATALIEASNKESIIIPYKYNRLVVFNSSFFHKSLPVRTKSGYQNRRINYTFLFS